MAKAGFRLHHTPTPKQSPRHADSAVYGEDAALLIERSAQNHITVTTQGVRDSATGRAGCATATLTVADAVRARRALGLVIRQARKSAAAS